MATLLSSSCSHFILHRFVLRRPPLLHPSVICIAKQSRLLPFRTTASSTSSRSLLLNSTPPSAISQLVNDVELLEDEPVESDRGLAAARNNLLGTKTPPVSLTVKEKKELASYAHSLGKKLKSQQVGKSGVTDTVIMALIETLEANELLKLKIHGTCPGELDDVVKQLEETTGSVVVGQIGRTVILYRPSLTKLKAEEKRRQAQRVYMKKQQMASQLPQSKRPVRVYGQESRQFGRGRRGSSRL